MATIVISDKLHRQLISWCADHLPEEACGLVAGTVEHTGSVSEKPVDERQDGIPEDNRIPVYADPDDVVKTIERLYPVENIDHSAEHFTIDPADQLRVIKQARAEGLQLLGNFHSHPATPARPSAEDKRLLNDVSASYLIVSFAAEQPQLNAFHIDGDEAWREAVVIASGR